MLSDTKACGQCSQTLAAMTLFRSMQKDQAEGGVTKEKQNVTRQSRRFEDSKTGIDNVIQESNTTATWTALIL